MPKGLLHILSQFFSKLQHLSSLQTPLVVKMSLRKPCNILIAILLPPLVIGLPVIAVLGSMADPAPKQNDFVANQNAPGHPLVWNAIDRDALSSILSHLPYISTIAASTMFNRISDGPHLAYGIKYSPPPVTQGLLYQNESLRDQLPGDAFPFIPQLPAAQMRSYLRFLQRTKLARSIYTLPGTPVPRRCEALEEVAPHPSTHRSKPTHILTQSYPLRRLR